MEQAAGKTGSALADRSQGRRRVEVEVYWLSRWRAEDAKT
jgi:hypothetical protein